MLTAGEAGGMGELGFSSWKNKVMVSSRKQRLFLVRPDLPQLAPVPAHGLPEDIKLFM